MCNYERLGCLAVIIGVILLVVAALNPNPPWSTGAPGANLYVYLASPANNSNHTINENVSLTGWCETNGTVDNATFWVYYENNGSVATSMDNETAISNYSNFTRNFTAPKQFLNYTWNLQCFDNFSMFENATNNYTFRVTTWVNSLLASPANNSVYGTNSSWPFTGWCESDATLGNATFWFEYSNGTMSHSLANSSTVSNYTNFTRTWQTPSFEVNYTWWLECTNDATSANSSKRDFDVYYLNAAIAYYPANTTGFEYECNSTGDLNALKTPDNQTNTTSIMVFNNTGNYTGSLLMSVNATPHYLEFYASQDDNYSHSSRVYASQNTTLNSSLEAGESALLWWWVNCSNSTVDITSYTEVYTKFYGWFR